MFFTPPSLKIMGERFIDKILAYNSSRIIIHWLTNLFIYLFIYSFAQAHTLRTIRQGLKQDRYLFIFNYLFATLLRNMVAHAKKTATSRNTKKMKKKT